MELKSRLKLLINILNLIRSGSQLPPKLPPKLPPPNWGWGEVDGYFVNDSGAVIQSAPRYYRPRSKLINSSWHRSRSNFGHSRRASNLAVHDFVPILSKHVPSRILFVTSFSDMTTVQKPVVEPVNATGVSEMPSAQRPFVSCILGNAAPGRRCRLANWATWRCRPARPDHKELSVHRRSRLLDHQCHFQLVGTPGARR